MIHSVLRHGLRCVRGRSSVTSAIALFALPSADAGQTATFTGLGHMPETMLGGSTYVDAVSGDGSTIVGHTWVGGSATVPFRWTAATGYQNLGTLGGTNSPNNIAYDVSFDGSVAVGQSALPDQNLRGFRWTASTGMIDMGTLGGPMSTAHGASHDGSVIVGKSLIDSGSASIRAFIWKQSTGMLNLKEELIDAGATGLQNWILAVAADVSDDGSVIVGWGHPAQFAPAEPFIATFGSPPVPGDVNGDGLVDVADFLALLGDWGPCPAPPADCPADVIPNGIVDVSDLLYLLQNWS